MTTADTIAACLTPAGTGAIATIAVHGPAAWAVLRALLRPRSQLPPVPESGGVWLTRLGTDVADEVVVGVKAASPVPWIEVHCHGGREVVRLLLEALAAAGARVCPWPEFVRLTGGDPLQALAVERLAFAPTARTAAVLLAQHGGAFRRDVELILSCLDRGAVADAQALLRAHLEYAPVGRHLVEPWQVAIAGAPNVGKSSLVNALAGYQRSIVSPAPGTTRDVVTALVALDGWPVELADTAGLRREAGALEGLGIERARGAAATADLCLWVLDAAAAPVWPDVPPRRVLLVVNKVDLPPAWDLSRAADSAHVSARTGAGIPDLCDVIVRRLVPRAPSAGQALPFTPELCDRIAEAHAQVEAGRLAEARRVLQVLLAEPRGSATRR